MNKDRAWLIAKAEQEDGCLVSVGGLVCALEKVFPDDPPPNRLAPDDSQKEPGSSRGVAAG